MPQMLEPTGRRTLQWVIIALLGVVIALLGVLVLQGRDAPEPNPQESLDSTDAKGTAATATPTATTPAVVPDSTAAPLQDGLYVDGFLLDVGTSKAKVLEKFGTEDERGESPDGVSYSWKLPDRSYLGIDFSRVGGVIRASLSWGETDTVNPRTYAAYDGRRIVPNHATLGSISRSFPEGTMSEPNMMENSTFQDYRLVYGGEGSLEMTFVCAYESIHPDLTTIRKSQTEVKRLQVYMVTAGLPYPE